ncbi:MAG: 3-deoxy-D-manno-octulosonic acid transferase [Lentimonas sp.]
MVFHQMIWFYRLLYLPCLLIALPHYIFKMWLRGGYAKSFQHRFGRFRKLPAPIKGTHRIWLQAVSVGEVLAIGPLISELSKIPNVEIVLTTTTSTGYEEARKRYADKALAIGIFPLDFWLFSKAAWRRIQPTAILMTESELWPEHLHQASKRKTAVFLVNARISERSFKRYQTTAFVAPRLLKKFDLIFAASRLDQTRLIELGARAEKIFMHGSIKFDVPVPQKLSTGEHILLRSSLGFEKETDQSNPFVLLGSSTWAGEEAVLIQAQQKLIDDGIDCRLLIVPRHAERASELVKLIEATGLAWHQKSSNKAISAPLKIHLADTTGELAHLSQAADLAFIGKSLPPHNQGQTPIEAAGLGIPILMGPEMSNFEEVSKSLVKAGAAIQVHNADDLIAAITRLASDSHLRAEMGIAGSDLHAKSRGSSHRIAKRIERYLDAFSN